MKSPAL